MLPPGLGFNAVGAKALAAAKHARLPKSYWDWQPMLAANAKGVFPYTPATNLLYGLREALAMLQEEGLEQVFARHDRHAEATRRAVRAWGLEILCLEPREYSSSLTAVLVPQGHQCRRAARDHPGALRPVARQRARQAGRPGVPDRSSRRLQRSDARRHPVRHRDGPARSAGFAVAGSGVAAALDYLCGAVAGRRRNERARPDSPTAYDPGRGAALLDLLAARRGLVCAVGAGGKKTTLYRLVEAHLAARTSRIGLTCTVAMAPPPPWLGAPVIEEPSRLACALDDLGRDRSVTVYAQPSPKPGRVGGVAPDVLARLHHEGGVRRHAGQGGRRPHALDQGARRG